MKFITDRFEQGAKIVLFVLAGALPLWFVPSSHIGIDRGREITFGILILLAVILWLLHILSAGEIRYQRSPLLWAALAAAAVFGASALASQAPMVSVLFADASAEKLSSFAAMLVVMITAGSVLWRREDAGTLLFVLIFSGAASAVLTFLQISLNISIFRYLNIANGVDANAIGTINGLALFYAALLSLSAGLTLSRAAAGWHTWVRWALYAASLAFLVDIALINSPAAWITLLGTSVFLFGLALIQNRMAGNEETGDRQPLADGVSRARQTTN